jgi:hypothetical protein
VPFRSSTVRAVSFLCPISPPPRTAVLLPGFRSQAQIRVFAGGWSEQAEKFAPESIAATLPQLVALASAGIPLTHSIIVLERAGDPHVSPQDRDRLWQAFEVPLFEQMIGPECELLAFECEAHDGLHIASPNLKATPDEIDGSLCGCGLTTPRLIARLRRFAASGQ